MGVPRSPVGGDPTTRDPAVRPGDRNRAGLLAILALGVAVLLGGLPLAPSPSARAVAAGLADEPSVTLVLFHGEGCPHCAAERAYLQELGARYPQLRVKPYEVWNDQANRDLLAKYAQDLGFEPTGVPVTIINDRVWIGFSDSVATEIEQTIIAELASQRASPGASPSPGSTGEAAVAGSAHSVDLPVLGPVDLTGSSLLVATLVIGFADGINPCSLWVLAVLLAMVLHSGSRGRVALVGATFLTVTAAMYGLYIVGMYSALDYVGQLVWIRLAVAAIALLFGVLQLKDAIAPGVGPSLSISAKRRPGIYQKMRAASRPDRSLPATIAGTAALAVGVSLLETPCTAGLPLLWTTMLADHATSTTTAVALFAVYMTVFLIDELILFGAAVITMRARRLQPDEGRLLKLISGSLLVTLGLTMIVAPQAMTGLASTMLVFAIAGLLALIIWTITRARPGGGHSAAA